MTKTATKFQLACRRFKEDTDLNYEELTGEELLEIYFLLAHALRGTMEDRLGNLALIIAERQGNS